MARLYRKTIMSLDELPRQRLYRIVDLPAAPDSFKLLPPELLGSLMPPEPGLDIELVVQAQWSWSPMHSRISNWEIGPDESGHYWVLWCSFPTDDTLVDDWYDPDQGEVALSWATVWNSEIVAACAKHDVDRETAAFLLLAEAWIAERDGDMELDRPHFYGSAGVIDIDSIRSIEREVWG